MSIDTLPITIPRESSAQSADLLVRRLGGRYLLVLLTVAILIVADQAAIQPLLVRMDVFAPAINKAGRQRMLSQKLAKAALAMQAASDRSVVGIRRAELRDALAEWSAAHAALSQRSLIRDDSRIQSPALNDVWAELQPHFEAMQTAARLLVDETTPDETKAAAVTALVNHEAPFLASMERFVKLMQDQAATELWRLRAIAMAIAAAVLALIVGLGAFVVRPATRAILEQVDQLESHVAQRTRELDKTLASLRHEIDERHQTESRNRALAAQLAHADRVQSLGRLAAGLAHELNQPLGAIANYAAAANATLAGPWDESAAGRIRDYLRQLNEAALRAGAIVRRIRNYVRPGASNVAAIEMKSLVAEVVELCRPEAVRLEVDVALHLPDDEIVVHADGIQIQQVLVNLVQNALQAMVGSPPQRRRLDIGMSTANDGVQIDVRDSGPGLAVADHETLFAPFKTTKPDGLGIGLSICRSIIEQHRGAMWAKSLPLQGAQFSFVLPLAAEHALQPA